MLRYGRHLLWFATALIIASALWVLNVEITYERNVRHIPTDFRMHQQSPTYRWRA